MLNEAALDDHASTTRRTPDMNRADLMALIAGCRTGRAARRRDLRPLRARDLRGRLRGAARAHPRGAWRGSIREYIPEEPVTFTDYVDDDGLGNGPFKMVLTIWRDGDVCHVDWTGTDPQAPGSINFHIHEGLCKLFFGIYLIMAFDP